MSKVMTGRMTHRYDGELVVFHIGMQINKPWRPDLWLPVFGAMPRMLRELSMDPDSGLLGYALLIGRGGPYVVQYWSSAAEAVRVRLESVRRASPGVDALQQGGAQGARRRRDLARDVHRRARRDHVRVDAPDGTRGCDRGRAGRAPSRSRQARMADGRTSVASGRGNA